MLRNQLAASHLVCHIACHRLLGTVRQSKGTVAVAMSGGIDSSVAAMILKDQGYDCIGVFMRNWDSSDEVGEITCSINRDREHMREVCQRLDIPAYDVSHNHFREATFLFLERSFGVFFLWSWKKKPPSKDVTFVNISPKPLHSTFFLQISAHQVIFYYVLWIYPQVDFVKDYWNDVFVPFLDTYRSGSETPNPDVMCNRYIKFQKFKKHVHEQLGIRWVYSIVEFYYYVMRCNEFLRHRWFQFFPVVLCCLSCLVLWCIVLCGDVSCCVVLCRFLLCGITFWFGLLHRMIWSMKFSSILRSITWCNSSSSSTQRYQKLY